MIDENYSNLLIDLSLTEVILLDKIQKGLNITDEGAKLLKAKNLLEGRKPNYYISSKVAEITNQRAGYLKNRGLKDKHYKELVLEYVAKYGTATKEDIDKLILDILPAILDEKQKQNKVRNLLYAMHKRDKSIENEGTNRKPLWKKFI